MNAMKEPLIKNSLKYGSRFGLIMIIASFGLYFLKSSVSMVFGLILLIILILGMVIGTKQLRNAFYEGFISYKVAFFSCFLIGFFASFMSWIFNLLIMYALDPILLDKYGNLPGSDVLSSSLIGFITIIFEMLIIGAIVAFFLQKKSPEPVLQNAGGLIADPVLQQQIEKERNVKDLIYGFLWLIGGILVTAITYSIASNEGGTYVIAYGAIILGGLQFLRGLFKYISGKKD